MPILSDGLNYGITWGRANDLQRQHGVYLRSRRKFQDYIPLLDVIIEHKTEAGIYMFTGKNPRQFLESLLAASRIQDHATFDAWLQDKEMTDQAMNDLAKLPNIPLNHFFTPTFRLLFHSVIWPRLKKLSMPRATAEQWRNTLANMTREGVKEEEIVWSGLHRYLSARDGMVEKADLMNAMNISTIRLVVGTESFRGADLSGSFKECCTVLPWRNRHRKTIGQNRLVLRYRHQSLGYGVAMLRSCDLFSPPICWFVVDDKNRLLRDQPLEGFATIDEAKHFALRSMLKRFDGLNHDQPKNRWRDFILPEGGKYQEWLLTLPNYPQSFYSSHFQTRNVLVHVRTTIRHGLDGKRLLFLEEVQSDWHQRGRHFGYKPESRDSRAVPVAPFKNEWHALALKTMLLLAVKMNVDGLSWSTGAQQLERFPEGEGLEVFYDKAIPSFLSKLAGQWDASITSTCFRTREPLYEVRHGKEAWEVLGKNGAPITKPFGLRAQAEVLASLLSPSRVDAVPVLWINDAMRKHIAKRGLPLFGHKVE